MAVAMTSACADPRSIGTLVHEGPVAHDASHCFAAIREAHVVWVSTAGGVYAAPTTAPPVDLTLDGATGGILARTRDALLSLHPHTLRVEDVPLPAPMLDTERVWATPSGLLTMRAGGHWTAIDEDGRTTSRWLPEARGLWFDGADILWQGASHPRLPDGVLVRGEVANPLPTAALVTSVALAPGALVAPGATSDELMVFAIEDGVLTVTRSSISGDEGEPSPVPWLVETSARAIASVTRIHALAYVVALENPSSLLVVDLDEDTGLPLEGLRGPVAGPVACPELIGSPLR